MELSGTLTRRHAVSKLSRETSSRRSSGSRTRTRALLSIKPPYAAAILSGRKRYEYRRAAFTTKIKVVVVYVTMPVKQVVAEFDVVRIISEPPAALWRRTRRH